MARVSSGVRVGFVMVIELSPFVVVIAKDLRHHYDKSTILKRYKSVNSILQSCRIIAKAMRLWYGAEDGWRPIICQDLGSV